jgi:hypothetical protein
LTLPPSYPSIHPKTNCGRTPLNDQTGAQMQNIVRHIL